MSRQLNRLEAGFLRSTVLPLGRHADGGGLYLQVTPSNAQDGGRNNSVWVFRYTGKDGREHWQGLGGYPAVTLAAARERATDARRSVAAMRADPKNHADPLEGRAIVRRAAAINAANAKTFADVAAAWIKSKAPASKNPEKWAETQRRYLSNLTWGKATLVTDIDHAAVVRVLEPLFADRPAMAKCVQQCVKLILDFAYLGVKDAPANPARWEGNLQLVFGATKKAAVEQHHGRIEWRDMPEFFAKLRALNTPVARALAWHCLNGGRSAETIGATRGEVAEDVWTVPAARMKGGLGKTSDTSRPVAPAALDLIDANAAPDSPLFGINGEFISDDSMRKCLQETLGYKDATPHGFRSTFTDWAIAHGYADDLHQKQTAHVIGSKVRRAYARDDLINERRPMMAAYADFCTGRAPASAKVVPLRSA